MLEKLIEKVIGERLQVHSISSNFIHSNQLEGLKQWSIIDAGLYLTHLIYTRWVKDLYTSALAFDIAQFFLLLNYWLKVGFNLRISSFFSNYLMSRKTQYVWNNFVSPSFRVDIRVDQESALSPILSALYIVFIFHIFEKKSKNLNSSISVSTLFFVDKSLVISQ